MTDENKMFKFGPDEIRQIFGKKIEGLSDICLFPLLQAIVHFLRGDISKNSQKIGITYARLRPNQDNVHSWHELVIRGKIVDFNINSVDIDEKDDDEMIWSVSSIIFSGPEAPAKKIFLAVKKIVAGYNLDTLKDYATEQLKKEKTYHLGDQTRYFYKV
jgi:hypothetical protein